jgi:hypothetical protein
MPSIAVDTTGKAAIGYFDLTNTGVKFAHYDAGKWSNTMIEDDKHVGTNPSLAFDIDGNAYLGYYKRSGGNLRLATWNRDADTWSRLTVDGATDGTDVGADLSVDVGEAAVRSDFGFTQYDTTIAVAYSDSTNGNLKYARLDLDDPNATWFNAVVDNSGSGVGNIDLNLHAGPARAGSAGPVICRTTPARTYSTRINHRPGLPRGNVATARKVRRQRQLSTSTGDDPISVSLRPPMESSMHIIN